MTDKSGTSIASHPLYSLFSSTWLHLCRIRMTEAVSRHAINVVKMESFESLSKSLMAAKMTREPVERKAAEFSAMSIAANLFRDISEKDKGKLRRSINCEINMMNISETEKKNTKRKFDLLVTYIVSKF